MSGLLALLDDVAALAKLAAVQLDDVAAQATKAGSKTVGVVIDDSAVTPKYVQGLPAARELPIVWKIARGSLFNKLVILLPAALLLHAVAPWILPPLLMLGGGYLCYEGAEKVLQWLGHGHETSKPTPDAALDAARLEEQRVAGAIKTDFILSAEIMTIALSAIDAGGLIAQAGALATVAVGITALVYGSVAVLVKADDVGLRMSQAGTSIARQAGRGIVRNMPAVMTLVATIGTLAMLWVGGSIITHGLATLGLAGPEHLVHGAADVVGHALGSVPAWLTGALLHGVLGLGVGAALLPIVARVMQAFRR